MIDLKSKTRHGSNRVILTLVNVEDDQPLVKKSSQDEAKRLNFLGGKTLDHERSIGQNEADSGAEEFYK